MIELDITSVKKNPTTLKSLSNVLNELLFNLSKKFVDQSMYDYAVELAGPKEALTERFGKVLESMDASLADLGL